MRLALALLAAGLLLSTTTLKAGASLGPNDFSVTADWPGPVGSADFKPVCGQPVIPPPAPGQTTPPTVEITCTAAWTNQVGGLAISGRATRLGDGANGPFTAVCDWTIDAHSKVVLTMNEARQVVSSRYDDFGGKGTESCSWSMSFSSSSINGTISGRVELGFVSGRTASFNGDLVSEATSGSGEYDKATGGGAFTQSQQITLPDPSKFPGSPVRRLAAAVTGQALHLTLHSGTSRTVILLPGKTILRASTKPYRLHLSTSPGSSCRATATAGQRTVQLGRAADGNRDGTVLFGTKLTSALSGGAWTLHARCTAGGHASLARAAVTIK